MNKYERRFVSVTQEPTNRANGHEATGNRLICAVMTADARYSLSPTMHNLAYAAAGIDGRFIYIPLSTAAEELEETVQRFRKEENFRGISVGVPHKQTVIPMLDVVDEASRSIGAVNTITIDRQDGNTTLTGTNTDWVGIREPLVQRIDLKGKHVAVVGAGGAARAATYAVLHEGATGVKIYNRTLEHAQALAADFGAQAGSLDDLDEIQDADVIIHATKLGMNKDEKSPIPIEFIQPHHVLFDVVYHRDIPRTKLAEMAEAQGATVIPGREMLLYQGIEQFRLFTGHDAPIEIMRGAIK